VFQGRRHIRTIEEQFSTPIPEYGSFGMSKKRYDSLVSSLKVNWPIFEELLRDSWSGAVDTGTNFVLDESIFAFFSQSDPTSPQRYIPRKPHKNGLVSYFCGMSFPTGHPYMTDIFPDTKVNQKPNPRDVLFQMIKNVESDSIIHHWTADAAFSGEEFVKSLLDIKTFFTIGLNIQHKKWLYELLDFHCPENSSISVQDRNGLIWTLTKRTHDNGSNSSHFVVSNAFHSPEAVPEPEPLVSANDVKLLSKLTRRTLHAMYNLMGANNLNQIIQKLNSQSQLLNISNESTTTNANTSESSEVIESNEANQSNGSNDTYSPEELKSFSAPKLRSAVRRKGLKQGSTRAENIKILLDSQRFTQVQIQELKESLTHSSKRGNSIISQHYKDTFNSVDLINRRYYDLQWHHTITKWEPKFIISILEIGFINSFSLFNQIKQITLFDFVKIICQHILKK